MSRYMRYLLWMLLPVVAAFAVVSCNQKVSQPPQMDREPLLLEDYEAPEDFSSQTGTIADNYRCHVCHFNYEDEKLAVIHARGNIGCQNCHGDSDAHCSDEDNITPPQIMYPAAKVNPFCITCHPKGKLSTKHEISVIAGAATGAKNCTDCHGSHRLSHRTRKWDKVTGRLIEDDKVRMMTDEM